MLANLARVTRILLCDDDPLFISHFTRIVSKRISTPLEIKACRNTQEALQGVDQDQFDLLFLDVRFGSDAQSGLEALKQIKLKSKDLPVVMISAFTDLTQIRTAMRSGAWDYIPKSLEEDEFVFTLERTFERLKEVRQKFQGDFEISEYHRQFQILGSSPQVEALKKVIPKFRDSSANVLITGETGTGKEVVARQLRKIRPDGTLEPFVAVDSSTIQSSIAEGLLFGYQKGAFTGAETAKKGLFEEADGGCIYFDEMGNMPLEIQAKLLRVVQEKEVVRLGSSSAIKLNFRVIAATNLNLEEQVKKGAFKADLLERLNVLPVELSPLRERGQDVLELVDHFLGEQWCWSEGAKEAILKYSWPGNIRELKNVLTYIATLKEGGRIDLNDLPPKIKNPASKNSDSVGFSGASQKHLSLSERLLEYEVTILKEEWAASGHSISKMAESLKMDRSNLHKKLKSLRIIT